MAISVIGADWMSVDDGGEGGSGERRGGGMVG